MIDETGAKGTEKPFPFTTTDLNTAAYFQMHGVRCAMTGRTRIKFTFERTEKFEELYRTAHSLETTIPYIKFVEEIERMKGDMQRLKENGGRE